VAKLGLVLLELGERAIEPVAGISTENTIYFAGHRRRGSHRVAGRSIRARAL
jgi:hypothetical protein